MEQWVKNLRTISKRKGLKWIEIAALTDLKADLVRKYGNGFVKNPRGDVLARLSQALGVSEQDLRYRSFDGNLDGNFDGNLDDQGLHQTMAPPLNPQATYFSEPEAPTAFLDSMPSTSGETHRWIPELNVRASMGDGLAVSQEYEIARWGIPITDMPTARGAVRIITAIGDSMMPTIQPNQKVAIDLGHTVPSPAGIYAIHDGDDLTLKRVERDMEASEKTYLVTSDNPRYKSFRLGFEDQTTYRICGRMIATWQLA